jgi:hypothetical protein
MALTFRPRKTFPLSILEEPPRPARWETSWLRPRPCVHCCEVYAPTGGIPPFYQRQMYCLPGCARAPWTKAERRAAEEDWAAWIVRAEMPDRCPVCLRFWRRILHKGPDGRVRCFERYHFNLLSELRTPLDDLQALRARRADSVERHASGTLTFYDFSGRWAWTCGPCNQTEKILRLRDVARFANGIAPWELRKILATTDATIGARLLRETAVARKRAGGTR